MKGDRAGSWPQGTGISLDYMTVAYSFRCPCGSESRRRIAMPVGRTYHDILICHECGEGRDVYIEYRKNGLSGSVSIRDSDENI